MKVSLVNFLGVFYIPFLLLCFPQFCVLFVNPESAGPLRFILIGFSLLLYVLIYEVLLEDLSHSEYLSVNIPRPTPLIILGIAYMISPSIFVYIEWNKGIGENNFFLNTTSIMASISIIKLAYQKYGIINHNND